MEIVACLLFLFFKNRISNMIYVYIYIYTRSYPLIRWCCAACVYDSGRASAKTLSFEVFLRDSLLHGCLA